jgi:hypothetical protein
MVPTVVPSIAAVRVLPLSVNGTGDMWNSNSLISWLLARSGHHLDAVAPPAHGRAPGWAAGLVLAARQRATEIVVAQVGQQCLRQMSTVGQANSGEIGASHHTRVWDTPDPSAASGPAG